MGLISKSNIKNYRYAPFGIRETKFSYNSMKEFGNIIICEEYIYISFGSRRPSFFTLSVPSNEHILIGIHDDSWNWDRAETWDAGFPKLNTSYPSAYKHNVQKIYSTNLTFDDMNTYGKFKKVWNELCLSNGPDYILKTY